jgi:UDP-hydrolysing UDP-N-acetyl-D-glucosamine 2-epimerase
MGDEVPSLLKVGVVTGSRADYGHLRPLLSALVADPDVLTSLIVTGSHLSTRFGNTIDDIISDGFPIAAKIATAMDDDSATGVAVSFGEVLAGVSKYVATIGLDVLLVYGDRWEMLAATIAAFLQRVPLAHIGGGDVTEGAYDEGFRHSITKMAQVHFVTHDEAYRRVLQMGEEPSAIFNVGSLALDALQSVPLLSRKEFEKESGYTLQKRNILVTFHPTTLEGDAEREAREVLEGLRALPSDVGILITQPGLDVGSLHISHLFREFCESRVNSVLVKSLGQRRYYSAIALCDAVVGNSSSGLYEVPSFKKPTVNIGNRQGGRRRAPSVLDVATVSEDITAAILRSFELDVSATQNPYGDGSTASRIVSTLKQDRPWRSRRSKQFHLLRTL